MEDWNSHTATGKMQVNHTGFSIANVHSMANDQDVKKEVEHNFI